MTLEEKLYTSSDDTRICFMWKGDKMSGEDIGWSVGELKALIIRKADEEAIRRLHQDHSGRRGMTVV